MDDLTTHRVALEVLQQAELLGAIDLEGEQRVEPALAREGPAQRAALDADRLGILLEAVQHAWDAAFTAELAAATRANRAVGFKGEQGFAHLGTPTSGRTTAHQATRRPAECARAADPGSTATR